MSSEQTFTVLLNQVIVTEGHKISAVYSHTSGGSKPTAVLEDILKAKDR